MTADELRELAEWLRQDGAEQHDRAAAYLRACADALDAGPVAWHYDGRDHISVYPLAMPGALRLPEPMTDEDADALLEFHIWNDTTTSQLIRAVEKAVLRRVKEANE